LHDATSWSMGCAGDELALHVEHAADGRVDGFVDCARRSRFTVAQVRREHHAGAARLIVDDEVEVQVEMLMGAPVPIDAGSVLDRALCRFRLGDLLATGWSSALERY
jgi:hypothetical protein